MRIAMLSYHTCPLATLGGKDTGGMNVYVRDLTRELGRRGIGVDVFTRSQDEHVPHVLHDLGYGNRIVHIAAGPEVPLPREELSQHLEIFRQGILAFADAKSIRYDLIHAHYWLSGLVGLELRKAWGLPLIQMFHTLGVMKNRVARSAGEIEPEERVEAEKRLLREADRVVAATQAELAQIQWLYQVPTDNVVVIPPGVDTARFYPIPQDEAKEYAGVPEDRHLILFVGRIAPLKGIDTLLEAIGLLCEQGFLDAVPIAVAVIGGEPDASRDELSAAMQSLERFCEERGLKEIVRFLGRRDQDSLPYYYSAADVVVVPSHYESFGLVALEAMACGRAVVASETGGLAFLIRDGETGFHVPAGDPSALAGRLIELLSDRKLMERMGKEACAYAGQFAWPLIADRILDLYGQMTPKYA
ncbi:MAG TPA: glycosyltransferase family 1 protein [Chloroflexi bacterium]|nr:glycosyltransferase family 1 protein [Chloroflexota bacterium]